ncbi:LuxR family transcriptional regulator [Sphingomonas sp. UNC305MFCol5.2]|uniref:LuxR family transcriptional regulator n=1 Tax=Sphingomonas sp. UNC305MFCol5.2 TaxID=1449076 RepID=UPI0004A6F7EF|nr:LuxR family transcriptional regulator [Sphingomonas sp. UNC305MFCol5.2]
MHRLLLAQEFEHRTKDLKAVADLEDVLGEACSAMGFRYFALMHHVDTAEGPGPSLRLHNYPLSFSSWFDENRFGRLDPVHRACHRTTKGFRWAHVPAMIRLGGTDFEILERARREGIANGFTVPAHVPGESRGSCSFAVSEAEDVPDDWLPVAQLIGVCAFETARRLMLPDGPSGGPLRLTARQRDCVIWAARGKTDWEIGRILGLSKETVRQHLKQARERYGIQKRSQLAVRALYDGVISFGEVLDS